MLQYWEFSLKTRPEDFFGPEDYDGTEHWEITDAKIRQRQAEWDETFTHLSWWNRIKVLWGGTVRVDIS